MSVAAVVCSHGPDAWETAEDGCEFCPECGGGVCPQCGTLYVSDGGEGYEPGCDCDEQNRKDAEEDGREMLREAAPELAAALQECLRIMAMYHTAGIPENDGHEDKCDMPENCGHCLSVNAARAALKKAGVSL